MKRPPSPKKLKKYEEALPSGGDRIMKMIEKEQDYKHNEKKYSIMQRHKTIRRLFSFKPNIADIVVDIAMRIFGKK